MKRATQSVGIDTSVIENLDSSFSKAIAGIQEKMSDVHKLINDTDANEIMPGISESLMNQWINENHSLLDLMKESLEQKKNEIPQPNKIVQYYRKVKDFAIFCTITVKSFFERVYVTLKNPNNLIKLMVLVLSIIFCSGLKQMPNFEKY